MFLRIIVASALLLQLSACQTIEQRSEQVEKVPLPNLKNELVLERLWQTDAGSGSKPWLRLNLAENKAALFTADETGRVFGLDKAQGKKIWQYKACDKKQRQITSGPAADQETVVFASRDVSLSALSVLDGNLKWNQKLAAEVLAPGLVHEGLIYVVTLDSAITALKATDGRVVWKHVGLAPALQLRRAAQPIIVGDQLIVGLANGHLISFQAKTGLINWDKEVAFPKGDLETDRMVDIAANPIYRDGKIFVSAYRGATKALNLKTGDTLWGRSDISTYSSLGAHGNSVLVSDLRGNIWSLDAKNGETQWKQNALQGRIFSPAAYLESQKVWVLGDNEGYLHALDQKGGFLARWKLDSKGIEASPILDQGLLYVLGRSGNVYALQISKSS
ncbi:MAG: outer membrane protein assembly factor BamB [Gammaproteobacteria bacterium]